MAKNVSDQIVEFLTEIGVKYVYGIPSDTLDVLMASLRKQDKIKFIVVCHEETGAFAACAQAKLTGELAVCIAGQGPGAIHLLNGLYDAALDGVPVLAITGQVDTRVIGTGAIQEINQILLFEDVSVYNQELRSPMQVLPVFTAACQLAEARRGVAHISIPLDVMALPAVKSEARYNVFHTQYHYETDPVLIDAAADLINEVAHVAILYGEGARQVGPEIIALAEKLKAPLIHTTRSKDVINNHHPQCMGGIGLMGSRAANYAVQHCEVFLVIGSSFAYPEYYPRDAKIIQIDRDPTRLSRHDAITLGLVGESKHIVTSLLHKVRLKKEAKFLEKCQHTHHAEDGLEAWEKRVSKSGLIHPQALIAKLNEYLTEDAVVCVDIGSAAVWTNNFLKLNGKQRFIWSSTLSALGSALAYSIGAQLAFPKRKVVCVDGDGGFNMLIGDFATLVHYQLPVMFVVLNNGSEWRQSAGVTSGARVGGPDFAALARAYGGDGIEVREYSQLDAALKKGMQSKVPFVVDVHVNPKELFVPPVIDTNAGLSFVKAKLKGVFARS